MTLSETNPDSLLTAPLTPGVRAEVKFNRPNIEALGYKNTGRQFKLDHGAKDYNRQFYKVGLSYFIKPREHIDLYCRFMELDWLP